MKAKEAVKGTLMIFGLFISAIVLQGILTSEQFAWWMVPTGVVCGAYLIGMVVVGFIKVKRGEW